MAENNSHYLEDQFHQDMVEIYKTAKRELHYNASYFIQMVAEQGGLRAALHVGCDGCEMHYYT